MQSSAFQTRHGLGADGRLGKETLRQLNMPLSFRVQQLEDALERWRWLPADFSPLPIGVNIPEFVLRVFSSDHRIAMRMNVVVGNAVRHETPVFAKDMQYIVFGHTGMFLSVLRALRSFPRWRRTAAIWHARILRLPTRTAAS